MRAKLAKAKAWAVKHQDGIFVGTTIVVFTGGLVLLFKAETKALEQQAEANKRLAEGFNAWADAERAAGNAVYPVA